MEKSSSREILAFVLAALLIGSIFVSAFTISRTVYAQEAGDPAASNSTSTAILPLTNSTSATNSNTTTPAAPLTLLAANLNSGDTISAIREVTILASDITQVDNVKLYVNSTLIGTEFSSPYDFSINTTMFSDGSYTVMAVATDMTGDTNAAVLIIPVSISNPVPTPTSNDTSSTPPPSSNFNPAITADDSEYVPGETVQLMGTGFAPGESYDIYIVRGDGWVVRGDGTEGHDTVTADNEGNFGYSYQLESVAGSYVVRVSDILQVNVIAETTFENLAPTIKTDKIDYKPEELVTISGEGFRSGQSYDIVVTRPDGSVVIGDGSFSSGYDTVSANSAGTFVYHYQLDGIQGDYYIDAYESGSDHSTPVARYSFADADTGPVFSSTATATAFWTNPSLAAGSDDNTCAVASGGQGNNEQLDLTKFGFSIPAGASIDGFLVEVDNARSNSATGTTVQLLNSTGTVGSAKPYSRPSSSATTCSTSDFVSTGSSTDLWGTTSATLTVAEINSDSFGVRIDSGPASGGQMPGDRFLDRVRMTIFYTEVSPPTVEAGAPISGTEGSSVSLSGASFSQSPANGPYTVDIDWGDGSLHTIQNPASPGTISASHTYPDDTGSPYTVTITVTDNSAQSGSDTTTATIANVLPVVEAGDPITGDEGASVSLSNAGFTDAAGDDDGPFDVSIDWGDGSAADVTLGVASPGPITGSHTYADDGPYTVTVTVTDDDGSSGSDTTTATIANVPPSVNAFAGATINEGQTYTSSGSFTDAGADSWTATVDYGDGTGLQPLALSGKTFSLSHQYGDNCACVVSVTVTDDDLGTGSNTATVTANNVAPVVGPINAPLTPTQINNPISVDASFTDAGFKDTHTALWNWGDGNTSPGIVTETPGSGTGSVTGTHTYTTPGVYTITLTVTDDDGGSGTQTATYYVVIYDPNGGFVTGGGWINSPAGAYYANPTLTGKANFGFVSKYQKGTSIPSGNTEFQFHAASLNFKSTSYEWLVIAGARAQYKGDGTINGAGNYGFMLTAIDGQISGGGGVDKFRVKIWDKNNGDAPVYDNMLGASDTSNPTTVLGGGSIVIHKPK